MEKPTDKQIAILEKNNKPIPATKQEATVVIGELFAKSDEAKETARGSVNGVGKNFVKAKDNSSFYVAYAKDLAIAIIDAKKGSNIEVDKIMEAAILCIKMAKKEFE